MASRKNINIYIPKYFLAVRNCINILFFTGQRYVFVDLFVYRQITQRPEM